MAIIHEQLHATPYDEFKHVGRPGQQTHFWWYRLNPDAKAGDTLVVEEIDRMGYPTGCSVVRRITEIDGAFVAVELMHGDEVNKLRATGALGKLALAMLLVGVLFLHGCAGDRGRDDWDNSAATIGDTQQNNFEPNCSTGRCARP